MPLFTACGSFSGVLRCGGRGPAAAPSRGAEDLGTLLLSRRSPSSSDSESEELEEDEEEDEDEDDEVSRPLPCRAPELGRRGGGSLCGNDTAVLAATVLLPAGTNDGFLAGAEGPFCGSSMSGNSRERNLTQSISTQGCRQ